MSVRSRITGGRRGCASAASVVLLVTALSVAAPASATVSSPKDCAHPTVPARFHAQLRTAIKLSGNLPMSWADSPYLAKIVCWQDTAFDARFLARGSAHVWHGVFAMTVQELKAIAGPWLSNDRNELILQPACFVRGWDACPRKAKNRRITQ